MDEVDASSQPIFERLDAWLDGFIRLIPNLVVGLIVFLIFLALARYAGRAVRRLAHARGRESLGDVGASLTRWAVVIVGLMLAITIISPNITPANLISGLGVSSVAIGFAFKDILQNMLSGILILLRQPFEVGDQIVSKGHEGTVERIETRATIIKTYDGRRVLIPNADVYTDAVVVNTAYNSRRSEYDIGIGCNDDWAEARRIMIAAASGCEGVLSDPAPEAIPVEIGDFANIIRLRWWTAPDRASQIQTFGRVIEASAKALAENGIDMPYPTTVSLFHDQTEETDGIRSQQREGWPARPNEDDPKPRRISDAIVERDRETARRKEAEAS
ncbi:mechanosensitive ion channel family protein [Roseobacter sp. HKCCA0434]|uniref:mechanosensitive ion channel family protein n=1 Tax=Roseobacter sp. HKCCA0434 TaxID=3079297 RepID=UPI0029059C5D|nr:mechanosensitive ion channel family protein [Roseobacter sp. HKCCA0434]